MIPPSCLDDTDFAITMGFSGYLFVRARGILIGICACPQRAHALVQAHKAQDRRAYHAMLHDMRAGRVQF